MKSSWLPVIAHAAIKQSTPDTLSPLPRQTFFERAASTCSETPSGRTVESRQEFPREVAELPVRPNAAQDLLQHDARQAEGEITRHQFLEHHTQPTLFRPGVLPPEDARQDGRVKEDHRARRSRL